MPELSIRGYAKRRGVSHAAVGKAIQQGRIRTLESGLIDAGEADRDWSRTRGRAEQDLRSLRSLRDHYCARSNCARPE